MVLAKSLPSPVVNEGTHLCIPALTPASAQPPCTQTSVFPQLKGSESPLLVRPHALRVPSRRGDFPAAFRLVCRTGVRSGVRVPSSEKGSQGRLPGGGHGFPRSKHRVEGSQREGKSIPDRGSSVLEGHSSPGTWLEVVRLGKAGPHPWTDGKVDIQQEGRTCLHSSMVVF